MTTQIDDLPADFPQERSFGCVPGAQPKVCVSLHNGKYVAGEYAEELRRRWEICEDLAHQLVLKATKDAAAHPEHNNAVTLERVRVAVARKGWVSSAELTWLMSRLRALLNW
ncbi:hypothetical protein [Paraburkholderia caribensis]|uniref:hypothetical protein n=1 Tax=Paraburkholderia caribensis TaxID=75105 RepID=UPI00078D9F22|nr:hypothetical protein [Paraburkholderia caribensis]AMV41314.1 hypothetical protein ATN79_01285 [Paraburkholderia caribensis]